jgi:hypothetical protein
MAAKSSGRSSSGRLVPVGYLIAAITAAALLLPTALRPPVDQQSSSAAFSPDAPPDDTPPEALLQAIRQASSSTAGGTINDEAPPPEEPDTITVQGTIPPPKPRAVRNRCFGENPPRQTESIYSAVCVPAWTGDDNGGATAFGVDKEEVRIGLTIGESAAEPEGPIPWTFSETDTDDMHDFIVWQTYFNERFEMYGRKMHFVLAKQGITDEDQQRQSVQKFKEFGTFAITAGGYGQASAAQAESVRQHIIDFGSVLNPASFYRNNHPYAFSFIIDGSKARSMHTELACKQFAGKPPGLLNEKKDLLMNYEQPRKWGLILYQDESHYGGTQAYEDDMAKCGVTFAAKQEFNLTSSQENIAGTMAKMKNAGVTTIIIATEVYTPIVLTSEASKLQYFPEWVQIGLEIPDSARLYDQDQAKHMVGLAGLEIPRTKTDRDYYRAYKEIDPEGDPADVAFRSLQQIAGGIQGAGPKLTPATFWEGLQKLPQRVPDPIWSVGGGYGPNDYTYMDYGSMIWWDTAGKDPNSSSAGAWQFVYFGKRYKPGEYPTDPVPWFDKSQSFTSPPKGTQG